MHLLSVARIHECIVCIGHGIGVTFWSRFGCMLECDLDLRCIAGNPLELRHVYIAEPSEGEVNKYHGMYIKRVQQLFDTHKVKYAPNGAELELF